MQTTDRTDSATRVRFWTKRNTRPLTAILLVLDGLTVASAFILASLLRFYNPWWPYFNPVSPAFYLRLGLIMLPIWILLFALHHLYDPEDLLGGSREYAQVFSACTMGIIAIVAYDFMIRGEDVQVSRAWLLLLWGFSILAVGGARFGLRRVVYALRRRGRFLEPAIVVGANAEGQAVARQLEEAPAASGVRVLGFVDNIPPSEAHRLPLPLLGHVEDLPELIGQHGVREIIVAGTALPREELLELFRQFSHNHGGATMRLSSGLFEILTTGMRLRKVGYVPLVTLERTRITGFDAVLKRALDIVGSLGVLLVLSPVLLTIALLVRATSPGPMLYRRRVLGQEGTSFGALKFRTMVVHGDKLLATRPELEEELRRNGKLKDDPRVTPLGRFLRRFSLDELPQFLNVLAGQMSLVGPRMIAPEEWSLYGKWQHNLLTVKPGMTGLWQVSGRSDLSYEDRVRLDMQYIRNYTIWLDLQIILQTVPVVVRGRGAY